MGIAPEPADVIRFALRAVDSGRRAVLVTLTGIEGRSSRAIGHQMVVAEDGASCGSFSSGCIDAAIAAEALQMIEEGRGCSLRFGAGSPFIDVRLPCGGGLDLLFTPLRDAAPIRAALAKLERRQIACLVLSDTGVEAVADAPMGQWGDLFCVAYHPAMRIVAFGQGEELIALARLSRSFGSDFIALAPRSAVPSELDDLCDRTIPLDSLLARLPELGDRWTAFAFMFHDRDWERALLPQMLAQDGFFHGAVGSHVSHAERLAALQRSGLGRNMIERLRGPIGLIPSARDPATLAISVLSEIVGEYRQCACAPPHMIVEAAEVPDLSA